MIFRVAGFHPYFLQVACYHAFETYRRPCPMLDRAQIIGGSSIRKPLRIWRVTGTLPTSTKKSC